MPLRGRVRFPRSPLRRLARRFAAANNVSRAQVDVLPAAARSNSSSSAFDRLTWNLISRRSSASFGGLPIFDCIHRVYRQQIALQARAERLMPQRAYGYDR